MSTVFIKLFNMSVTATWLALAVILLRPLLKKAPKYISVFAWALVGLRLTCPFSIESVLSLIPSTETLPPDIIYSDRPVIQSGIPIINSTINPIISESLSPGVGDSVNPMQVIGEIAGFVWVGGVVLMLLYTLISYLCIRRRVKEAALYQGNIWLCDRIDTPFILGIIRPRIYLPSSLGEGDRDYVLAHERAHLKRGDHFWKPFGFLLLSVYWFNPVLWAIYVLLCKDIELACDEKVIKELGEMAKKPYSEALINCSVPRKAISACPVAFGENGLKERVITVLNYKKPSFWIIIIAVVSCIALAVVFLTNPADDDMGDDSSVTDIGGADPPSNIEVTPSIEKLKEKYPRYFDLTPTSKVAAYVWQTSPDKYSCGIAIKGYSFRSGLSSSYYYRLGDKTFSYITGEEKEVALIKISKVLTPISPEEAHAILYDCMVPTENIEVIPIKDPTEAYKYELTDDFRNKAEEAFWNGLKVHIHRSEHEFALPYATVKIGSVIYAEDGVKLGLIWNFEEGFTESTKTEYPKYHIKITVGENSKFTFLPLPEEWYGDDSDPVTSTYVIDMPAKAGDEISLDLYHNDDKTFISNIFKSSFAEAPLLPESQYSDSLAISYSNFDIDGDGDTEMLELLPGYTSGLYTFKISISDKSGGGFKEYKNTFLADYYAPKRFCTLSDGELYLESERFGDSKELRYYKIELEGDTIVLRYGDETLGYWGK